MLRRNSAGYLCLTIAVSLFLLSGCGSGRKPQQTRTTIDSDSIRAGAASIQRPVMRIGLVDSGGGVVTVRSSGGLYVHRSDGRRLISSAVNLVSCFAEGADGRGPREVYRVQAASLSEKAAADALASRLRRQLGLPAVVRYSSQARSHRVQVGQAASRGDAAEIEQRVRALGYADAFVIRDSEPDGIPAGNVVLVGASGQRIASEPTLIISSADAGAFVQVGEVSYRGALEVRVDADGTILPINIVNLEEYLRGVLPAEMSSSVYPQLEALKAQALAARTYAWRNRGQYQNQGFDICNTAACQVYKGVNIEQEMTDIAVRQTQGQVLLHAGKPINALFTSTCGGHTEDVENIFKGDAAPYLRGVPCEPELRELAHIQSSAPQGLIAGVDGFPINYDLAVLENAGVLRLDKTADLRKPVSGPFLASMAGSLAHRLGREGERIRPAASPTLAQVAVYLVKRLGWEERHERAVSSLDLKSIFGPAFMEGLSDVQARALLFLLRYGFITIEPDGSLPHDQPVVLSSLVRTFSAILQREAPALFQRGALVRQGDGTIGIQIGREVRQFNVSSSVRLFTRFDRSTIPASHLNIVPGDTVEVMTQQGQALLIRHSPPVAGVTSDRSSRYFQWDVSYSREELRSKIARYVDVGPVTDLRPVRFGVSERVVELEITGAKGSVVLEGLRIRWALGLRENLFIIDRLHDQRGVLSGWRFIGRGWGHGVGLCQVGAYGMAQLGRGYREIVRHYYSGATVGQIRQ